jgi:hypothetical protein
MFVHMISERLFSSQVFAAVIAAGAVIATWLWNAGVARKSREDETKAVMAAFRSDIRSIVHVIAQLEIIESFAKVRKTAKDTAQFPRWSQFCPRGESYFHLYEALASKIGVTGHDMSREIVKFYAFLRASRDAAGGFEKLEDREAKQGQHVELATSVLQALSEMLTAADKALDTRFSSADARGNDGQEMALQLREQILKVLAEPGQSEQNSGSPLLQ